MDTPARLYAERDSSAEGTNKHTGGEVGLVRVGLGWRPTAAAHLLGKQEGGVQLDTISVLYALRTVGKLVILAMRNTGHVTTSRMCLQSDRRDIFGIPVRDSAPTPTPSPSTTSHTVDLEAPKRSRFFAISTKYTDTNIQVSMRDRVSRTLNAGPDNIR